MLIIFLTFLIILCVFGFFFLIVMRLLSGDEVKEVTYFAGEQVRKAPSIKQLFAKFAEDPKSRQSQKFRMLSFAVFLFGGYILTTNIFFTLVFGIFGFFFPIILLKRTENKRLRLIDKQLSDGLVLISNSLRSGLSFAQAIEVIAQQGQVPLAEEFQTVTQELKLGISMEQALNNLSERLKKSKEMRIAMTAINIARETGGNMSEALTTLSETMRKRNEMQGKIDALTAQGKLSGLITALLPFVLSFFIYLVAPDLMRPMFTTYEGYAIIAVVLMMIGIGALIINKVVTIDI
ncbi:MAG: type II secretion system F family protein [Elusimicrobia bacterium]|nr:type II secretion system F family protein [Elusimicrobiota bacterium]